MQAIAVVISQEKIAGGKAELPLEVIFLALNFLHWEFFDQSIASTKTKYIKLNTKTQIFFNNIRLLYTL